MTKHQGFTMAEILLSLTIIGVVAAITLPSLTGNINERTWNTQRKALYSRMSQAISLMPSLNGYGTLNDTTDNAAETFITSGLSKVLKINNICTDNYTDCGIVTSYNDMLGSKKEIPTTLYNFNEWFSHVEFTDTEVPASYEAQNTKAVAFETQNGESLIAYYNQSCRTTYLNQEALTSHGDAFGFPQANMCINMVYDLNGEKGPNTIGKDIGMITVFNATDSIVVAPIPSNTQNATHSDWYNAGKACKEQDPESRLPNIEELSSLYLNKKFIGMFDGSVSYYWSSSVYNTEKAWRIGAQLGGRYTLDKDKGAYVRCIKR